ncbi:MalY/PatB family protein [Bartonella sp. HY406]|uniref:MalY/PatB family protein n=1 Tax=Bartonella sp. HY406 TaxID=2979331 RepID=UPI0021C87D80|nr:MalY/PatB family protein [Bartonella sp. HY406]UXN04979.1 pyridoxal phosphate-dependent aminotransferase [Bartonella sp. HY406]
MVNFDETIDRKSSNSMKWSYPDRFLTKQQVQLDPLPMWVADMDFRVAPCITSALQNVLDHGVLGYSGVSASYKQAITTWQKKRHNWHTDPDWLVLSPGIVTMLNMIIQAFTNTNDSILVQPPVYIHFHQDVITNGRKLVTAPLQLVGERYVFDAELFEKAITADTKLFILCNPHNPTGNVWSSHELKTIGDICAAHNVIVVSDEIHGDLIMDPGKKFVPFASLGDEYAQNSIICTAASKSFNLAGLQCSNNYIANPVIREKLTAHMKTCGLNLINIMGMVATEAAYSQGEEWLEDLLKYVRENQQIFASKVNNSNLPLTALPMDSLYLSWLDCRQLNLSAEDLNDFFLTKAGLWFDDGRKFGQEGHGFMRVNLGCTRQTLNEALKRLEAAFQ